MNRLAICVAGYNPKQEPARRYYYECLQSVLDQLRPGDTLHVLCRPGQELAPHPVGVIVSPVLVRDVRDTEGGTRDLPYIKDILDFGAAQPCGVFAYLNCDILVDRTSIDALRNGSYSAYAFRRRELHDCTYLDFKSGRYQPTNKRSPGGWDLVGFTPAWWRANRAVFADYVIGEPYWDAAYARAIRALGKGGLDATNMYHRTHVVGWGPPTPTWLLNKRLYKAGNEPSKIPRGST